MAKLVPNTLANVQSESTFLEQLNENFTDIATAIENTLSRDGSSPNDMGANLDMDNNRIINLPAPTSDTEPARHGDIQTYVDQAEAAQEAAETAQTGAETAETNAETAETGAETAQAAAELALDEFTDMYLGIKETEPTVDNDGDALVHGAIYYNSDDQKLYIYLRREVMAEALHVLVGTSTVVTLQWEQGYENVTGFVEEAPNDGSYYNRRNSAWEVNPEAEVAPSDGTPYVRMSGDWHQLSADIDTIVVLTQLEYDALTPDATTLYFIEEE